MAEQVQVTIQVARVLTAFLEDPTEHRYGADLIRATNLQSGTLYPILARLERVGWLTSAKEQVDPKSVGRPARRYYRLTAEGVVSARQERAELLESIRVTRPASTVWGAPEGSPA